MKRAVEEAPTSHEAKARKLDEAKAPSVTEATKGEAEAPRTSEAEATEARASRTAEAKVAEAGPPGTTEVEVAEAGVGTMEPTAQEAKTEAGQALSLRTALSIVADDLPSVAQLWGALHTGVKRALAVVSSYYADIDLEAISDGYVMAEDDKEAEEEAMKLMEVAEAPGTAQAKLFEEEVVPPTPTADAGVPEF
ncbi:uncharacterized protein [Miscanthus floridulus]|uniref:uncharacterized protein n=1 Tax=Miscanthus floridulus TaxID=154761 RepID=UPI00345A0D28